MKGGAEPGARWGVLGRALLGVPLALLAGCATGLRTPPVTVGIDLDGDAQGRVTRVARAPGVDFAAWREGDGVRAVSGDDRPDPLDRPQDR